MIAPGCLCNGGEVPLLNPDFENDLDANDVPDDWIQIRRPVYDLDPAHSYSGSRSIKSNDFNFYGQEFDITGGAHYSFSLRSRGEANLDFGAMDIQWRYNGTNVAFKRGGSFLVEALYNQYLIPFLAPLEANRASFFPRSTWNHSWIWLDDYSGWDEFITNGDFEIIDNGFPVDWLVSGVPIVDCSDSNRHSPVCGVRVDNDDYLSQYFAAVSENNIYHLSFWTQGSPVSPASFTLEWYDDRVILISSDILEFIPGNEWGIHTFSLVPPHGAALGKLILRQPTSEPVWVDDIDLVWHLTRPSSFSPNTDLFDDSTILAYSVSQPTSITLSIIAPNNAPLRTLENEVIRDRSVAHISWDGRNDAGELLSDGSYRYELTMQSAYDSRITIQNDIIIDTSRTYTSPSNPFDGFFPRGLWVYGGGFFEQQDYDAIFQRLHEYNFNAAVINWIPESRFIDALDAGSAHDIQCILQAISITDLIEGQKGYDILSEESLRIESQRLMDAYASYGSLLGYYTTDEPEQPLAESVFRVNTVMSDIDAVHPGFSSLANSPDVTSLFETMKPAVFMHHYYPLPVNRRAQPSDFDGYIQNLDMISALAESAGKQFWMTIQGFSNTDQNGLITPAEIRCVGYLALAHGVDGIFYFTYQSSGSLIGIIDYEQNPTERLETIGEFMGVIQKMENVLLRWQRTAPIATSSVGSCLVNTFQEPEGDYYCFIVNKDCVNPAYPCIHINLVDVNQVYDFTNEITLPFFTGEFEVYTDIEIMPGNARILRIR